MSVVVISGLNPYYCGTYLTRDEAFNEAVEFTTVLILIIVELTLRDDRT